MLLDPAEFGLGEGDAGLAGGVNGATELGGRGSRVQRSVPLQQQHLDGRAGRDWPVSTPLGTTMSSPGPTSTAPARNSILSLKHVIRTHHPIKHPD